MTDNTFRTSDGRDYRLPFFLITGLFLLWGFGHSFLDVLNSHFEEALHTSKAHAASVHLMVYGGHFLIALPAGLLIRRYGYRVAMLAGLLLYGAGSLLFVPGGGHHEDFPLTLAALFVVGCGLGSLEVAANPYVAALGSSRFAARRMNLAQAFNGLGLMMGPIVGGMFLFRPEGHHTYNIIGITLADVSVPYAVMGMATLAIAAAFFFIKLPVSSEAPVSESAALAVPLLRHRPFVFGMVALFLYVVAQTGINSIFVYYATSCDIGISHTAAAELLGGVCLLLFLVGRLAGSFVLGFVRAERLLASCAVLALTACAIAFAWSGRVGLIAVFVIYLAESIMYPTLFALAIRNLGNRTGVASSLLEMCVVGGAVAPMFMGYIADRTSTATGFLVPLVCFTVVGGYALWVLKKG